MDINHYRSQETEGYEVLYLNSFYTIADSLIYPLLMSPVSKIDDNDIKREKIEIVSGFIDRLANIRTLQNRAITQTSMRNTIYELVKKARNTELAQLRSFLQNKTYEKDGLYHSLQEMNNGSYYHYFYARIWCYLDESLTFLDLLRSRKQSSYVLMPMFNEQDLAEEVESESQVYLIINSVANYCLLRRKDAREYEQLTKVQDKMNYLSTHGEYPELLNKYDSPLTMILERDEAIQKIIENMWGCPL